MAIVAQFNLESEQLYVKIVFLHGKIEEKIYMKQPKWYIHEGQKNKV